MLKSTQGTRTDLTSSPNGEKVKSTHTDKEQAKEKMSEGGGDKRSNDYKNRVSPNGERHSETKIHTDKELAKMAGVGTGTVARFNKVLNSDDEVFLDLLESNIRRRGEVGGSAQKQD